MCQAINVPATTPVISFNPDFTYGKVRWEDSVITLARRLQAEAGSLIPVPSSCSLAPGLPPTLRRSPEASRTCGAWRRPGEPRGATAPQSKGPAPEGRRAALQTGRAGGAPPSRAGTQARAHRATRPCRLPRGCPGSPGPRHHARPSGGTPQPRASPSCARGRPARIASPARPCRRTPAPGAPRLPPPPCCTHAAARAEAAAAVRPRRARPKGRREAWPLRRPASSPEGQSGAPARARRLAERSERASARAGVLCPGVCGTNHPKQCFPVNQIEDFLDPAFTS